MNLIIASQFQRKSNKPYSLHGPKLGVLKLFSASKLPGLITWRTHDSTDCWATPWNLLIQDVWDRLWECLYSVARRCQCCWPRDHTLRTADLYTSGYARQRLAGFCHFQNYCGAQTSTKAVSHGTLENDSTTWLPTEVQLFASLSVFWIQPSLIFWKMLPFSVLSKVNILSVVKDELQSKI